VITAKPASELQDGVGILSVIGKTPIIRLSRLSKKFGLDVHAKLELLNPSGSIKDRAALRMLSCAIADGRVGAGTTIIESSSGNLGVGLAQFCRYHQLRFICVVDPMATQPNLALIKAYGAEIDMVGAVAAAEGGYLQQRIARVQALLASIPDSYWPNQYANPENPNSYMDFMDDVVRAFGATGPDYLFIAASSCGTLRGCSEYIKQHQLQTRIVAVDAVGSVLYGSAGTRRLIPGHGAGRVPELFSPSLADDSIQISERDSIQGCRDLMEHEAILAGGSSGAIVAAIEHKRGTLRPGASCLVILADRGDRYIDTIYSDRWVAEHFTGEVTIAT